jgi:hypothetical protein
MTARHQPAMSCQSMLKARILTDTLSKQIQIRRFLSLPNLL